jgi:ribosomal protein L7Ae-like RNA K-turn-binding protein
MMDEARLGLLGLGVRAGKVVVGSAGVRASLRRDELALVVVAADASARTEAKVVGLARARGVPVVQGADGAGLGRRCGRGAVQALGVRDRALAAGLLGGTRSQDSRRS